MRFLPAGLALTLLGAHQESARQAREYVEKLGSETIEEREDAARKLKAMGDSALPLLEKATGRSDAEIAARARIIIRTIGIRRQLSAGFLESFPTADDRLAVGEPPVWTEIFLEATRANQAKPIHPGVEVSDLAVLAPKALLGAKEGEEHGKVCAALGERRVRSAVPAMIDWIKRNGKGTFPLVRALGKIGDAAAVPVLLDHPNLVDYDVVGDTSAALEAIGPAAFPEFECRILAWKEELGKNHGEGLALSLSLLGPRGSAEVKRARLDLVSHLTTVKIEPFKEGGASTLSVFRGAVMAIAPEHPDRVVEAIWAAVDSADTFVLLLVDWYRLPREVGKPVLVDLWTRLKGKPQAGERVREIIFRNLQHVAPEVLALEKDAVSGSDEARAILHSLGYNTDPGTVDQGVRRVEAFLATTPDPLVQFILAGHYLRRGAFEKCAPLLDAALPKLGGGFYEIQAHFDRAEARLRLGDADGAEKDLRTALDLRTKRSDGPIARDAIERQLRIVSWYPRDPKVRCLTDVTLISAGVKAPRWNPNSYMEAAGGRTFYLSEKGRLCAADPAKRAVALYPALGSKVRDFMPLDRSRVFVALHDGTAGLYDEATGGAAWTRRLSLGFHSCLTASPKAITAAEEDGTFHAIDPGTGKTLWTRKVEGRAWPDLWWRSERGHVQQGGETLALPTRGRALEIADLATGKVVSTYRPDLEIAKLSAGKEALFIVGSAGDVVALSLKDGATLWRKRLGAAARYPLLDVSVCHELRTGSLFVTFNERVWRLGAATGESLWEWTWSPGKKSGTLRTTRHHPWALVLPAPDGLYCVVNWETQDPSYVSRADVAFLSYEGKLVFQHTSPRHHDSGSDYAHYPFVVGGSLVFHKTGWEIWDRSDAK